jgi:hypothetical protein
VRRIGFRKTRYSPQRNMPCEYGPAAAGAGLTGPRINQ